MTLTPNFYLNKPEQTDFYNVDDFNLNADLIDEALKNLAPADMPPSTVKGRVAQTVGAPEDVAMPQLANMLSKAEVPVKATPVDADSLLYTDSVGASAAKRLTWGNIKAYLKTHFDTLFVPKSDIGAATGGTLPVDRGGTGATQVDGTSGALSKLFPGNPPDMEYIFGANSGWGTPGAMSKQGLRNAMGLGNTLGVLPIANGGTGKTTLDGSSGLMNALFPLTVAPSLIALIGSGWQNNGYCNVSDLRVPLGTATTDYGTPMTRGIIFSTTDMTAGVSGLTSGQIYLVYE